MKIERISERIARLEIPYKDIFTSVYLIKTDRGAVLFDTGSYDSDVSDCILPFLAECLVDPADLKYVFLSHNHVDHAGGLRALMPHCPHATVVSRSEKLAAAFADYSVHSPTDGEYLLEGLRVITISGHSADACGLFDEIDRTLLSGDSLQLYGIYGSGKWGANVTRPKEHFDALKKLEQMDIARIFTSHIYHPMQCDRIGQEDIPKALQACRSSCHPRRGLREGSALSP